MAHAWQRFTSAVRAGKQPWTFPNMLATFAARKTRMRRKVGKPMNFREVYNAAEARRLPLERLAVEESRQNTLADTTQTPVPDQVAFRLDFSAWLKTLPPRDRQIVQTLATAKTAEHVAKRI